MDTETSETPYRATRLNMLMVIAFLVVVLCLALTVFLKVTDEFAKGIITLILGRFLGYVDAVYNFEFGTTRGSKAKDDAITNLASQSPNAPSEIRKAVVDAGSKAAAGSNGGTTKVDVMHVEADNVNLKK